MDSFAQGGAKVCKGGGRVHRRDEGGGAQKRLTFTGVKGARDVELGASLFF